MSKRKRKTSCLSRLINSIFTLTLVAVLSWAMLSYSGAEASALKFAQISDVHLSSATENKSYRLTAESTKLFEDAIDYVNNVQNLDFTIFTGDMIDKPLQVEMSRFVTYANKLNMPYYTTLGNHDISVGGYMSKDLYLQIMKKNNKSFKFNRTYYSFVPQKGFRAFVLDTIVDSRITANGEISQAQLKWLDSELNKVSKDEVILIFAHVPLVQPFTSDSHKLLNADEVLKILKKHKNPIGVFTGHYHTTRIKRDGNIVHVSTPALISYPNAFRIVNIKNYKNKAVFSIEYVPTRLVDLQKKSKLLVFHVSTYYGSEEDRTVTLTIEK